MNILWITNSLLPEAKAQLLGVNSSITAGSWISALADSIRYSSNVKLSIASLSDLVNSISKIEVDNITYYAIPGKRIRRSYSKKNLPYWRKVKELTKPDVVHIHGTECPYGLEFIDACGTDGVIVSIQGLVSVIERYYMAGISNWTSIKNLTFHDIITRRSMINERNSMRKRGVYEHILLSSVKHVIGRTQWDKVHLWSINPDALYHCCNESLRPEFFNANWIYSKCIPHTIFISQGAYALKGVHILIKALSLVKKYYPDVRVRIAGPNIMSGKGLMGKLRENSYAKIIKRQIKTLDLNNNVEYIGAKDAVGMINELKRCNVFVSPSSIENSSNSLGEAQIVGTPCISSYCGGAVDFIPNDNCGYLYRFEEYEILAGLICKVFEESSSFDNTEMKSLALERHNPDKNLKTLLCIYDEVAEK